MDWQPLIRAAGEARERAHVPYSRFRVGSALLTAGGGVYSGCNVENRSYGATICAERVALGSAVAAGDPKPVAIVVVTDTSPPSLPCGVCLQCLSELAEPDLPIRLVNPAGESQEFRLDELLPHPFVMPPGGLG
ncbi:MAG: cytidine deaminase [Thermoanaerobaculia bacterium]